MAFGESVVRVSSVSCSSQIRSHTNLGRLFVDELVISHYGASLLTSHLWGMPHGSPQLVFRRIELYWFARTKQESPQRHNLYYK